MSGQTERARSTRASDVVLRSRASHLRPRSTSGEATAIQQRDMYITRQRNRLGQWNEVARKIIREISDTSDATLDEVSPSELHRVIEYIKLMKSSVEIYRTINDALKERVDELRHVTDHDGQFLQSILSYVQSLPVLSAVRDERTNELKFQVNFHSEGSLQIPMTPSVESETGERDSPRRRRPWFKSAISAAVCIFLCTSVAKSRFSKSQ